MNRTVVVSVMVAFFTCAALDAQAPHGGQTMPPQPGPNVNAVGGIADPRDPAALVKADLNLQRQNETVVAASARNPDHILAAANDYRFVDFPQDQYYGGAQNFFTRLVARLFGRPGQRLPGRAAAAVGAWTGVYRSCDRGRTWIGSALPGSPLDFSEASMASTLKRLSERAALQGGHAETTDPVLVAGPGGRMHLVVLGFVRFPGGSIGESHMYYASYTDRNNLEGGSCFTYDFMQEIDTGAAYAAAASPTPFIDKPALAVDKDGTLYAAYTVFGDTVKSRIVIARSTNGGATWTKTIPLLNLGFLRNHGTSLTIDPVDGTVYVAWRMFYDNWPLMVVSKSYDKGRTFLPATPMSNFWPSRNLQQIIDQLKAAKLQPFDQTSGDPDQPPAAAARAFAFPSIVAGVVNGRSKLFAAWTERADVDPRSTTFGLPSANGSPRIMMTTSSDGGWTWTARRALDAGPRTENLIQPGIGGLVSRPSAPQLQPVLSMSGTTNAQLLVMYYEAREELEAPFATSFISGIERMMDVRAARIDPVTARLLAPSVQVSQYPVKANSSPGALPEIAPGYRMANRQNLTMYAGGTTAFIGDYAGLAPVQPFEFKAGRWDWSADPSPSLAMWTDNRDVAFPMNAQGQPDINGAWTNYQPLVPTDPLAAAATSCAFVASRNSNPYFSEIGGVVAGAPQSFKPLTIQRAFATYVENRTTQDRFFRLTIDDNERQGIDGSFDQFDFGPAGDVRNVKIFANSSHHRTIWVQPRPQAPTASLAMVVQETVTLGGALKTDGYRTRVVLNPDPNNDALTSVPPEATQYAGNPAITSDTSELHNPQISSPQISTFRISAPQISSPQISTPQISTPQISTPQISTPQISTPQISSPQISTPQISTAPPGEQNGTDVTYTVRNEGTTWSTYDALFNVPNAVNLIGSGNYQFQLLITRTSLVPAFVQTAAGCTAAARQDVHLVANIPIPQISSPQISTISNPQISTPQISTPQIATFSLAPSGGAAVAPDTADPDSRSAIIPDQVQVTVRAIALKPRADILASGGTLFDPATVEARITSSSTNVVQGTVEAPGSQPSAVTRPDLIVATASPVPAGLQVPAGGAIAVAPVTIRNQGSEPDHGPGTSVGYYLSVDPVITTDDILLASDSVPPLPVGGEVTLEGRTLTIPVATRPGSYFIGVLVDQLNAVVETEEGNNYVSAPITVTSPLQLVVTNTNDAGAGSLRAAMLAANATPNVREEIRFSIPGPGPHRINLLSPLPAVTDPLFVNGTSQAGYAGVPLIEVSGPATPLITGLTIFAGNSRVNGLSLIGFGTALVLRNGGSNIVDGNYIGLSTNGTIAANALGIFITSSANNRIGGPTAAERNVISGNTQRGMEIRDASSGNRVINNYIGTSPDGLLARPNGTAGVEVVGASANTIGEPGAGNLISGNVRGVSLGLAATNNRVMANLIGTTRAGDQPLSNTELGIAVFADANTIGGTTFGEGNVISANGAGGILITNGLGGTGNGNFVYGNSIGLGIDAIQLGNGGAGVSIQGGAMNTIGGVTPASRNLIGSNARNGVVIAGATATGNVVAGNYIGLDDSGSSARPNFGVGVLVQNASGNRIGVIGGGNVLSGNLEAGIAFDHSDDNDVVGNRIGTTADGIEARPNGFVLEDGSVTGAGITLVQSPGNRIGSAAPGGGNLISGNGTGIWVEDAASAGTIITGNMIGTNAAGNSGIPNAVGLSLAGSATVGGIQPGAPNVISANTTTGILVAGNGTSVNIQENVISGNGGLGIDLGGDGVTRNDPGDVDEGSNHNQNVPVLTAVTAFSAATRIVGTLDSTPSSTFTLRFYANDSCDPSGFGEGQRSLGATTVSTDGAGSASFDVGVGRSGAGDVLTATATDGAGNTSEFSACRQATQWSAFLPPGTAAETTVTNPRSGNASLELLTARESSALINEPGTVFGNFADLNALSFDWAIDPASQGALPPDLALRVYAFGDPRSFFLHWDTCGPSVPCTFREKGSWQTTNLIGQLSIQADGSNTPPASLAEIPPDAPITGIHVRSAYNFGYPWFGYADNVVIGFRGQQPNVFNFELADPSASRIRPALTWTRPASIDDATPLSGAQLNAFGSTAGSFEYDPTAGTGLSADLHGLFTTFTAADASKYLPVSRAVPLTVTGLATVVPEDSSWFAFTPAADTAAAITLNNPRSGNGSLELTKTSNQGSAYLHEPNVLSFGAVSDLTSLSMDWFIDPASEAQLPPELALRVYDFGDPRSFFLYWDTCSGLTPCDPQPTGSWQTTNLIGRLRIQAAEGAAPPPASLAEIPPDAPIVGIHLRTNFGNGRPWHGFVDNVAIGFGGRSPIVFNFEPFGVIQQ